MRRMADLDIEKRLSTFKEEVACTESDLPLRDDASMTAVGQPSVLGSDSTSDCGMGAAPRYPDGGARAWLAVLGAFLALFCTFGQLNSFGTFQTWYREHQLGALPASTIAWIGSLQLWVFFFCVSYPFYLTFGGVEFARMPPA